MGHINVLPTQMKREIYQSHEIPVIDIGDSIDGYIHWTASRGPLEWHIQENIIITVFL